MNSRTWNRVLVDGEISKMKVDGVRKLKLDFVETVSAKLSHSGENIEWRGARLQIPYHSNNDIIDKNIWDDSIMENG